MVCHGYHSRYIKACTIYFDILAFQQLLQPLPGLTGGLKMRIEIRSLHFQFLQA
jgi:hypothetical protein